MVKITEPKQNILVSFSGGETSGFMIDYLLRKFPDRNYTFIFANTGEENEETLQFVENVANYYKIKVIWIEYERLGYKEVTFKTAYRSHDATEIANKWQNHPFRKYISHDMIPNIQNPTCSRELKEYIITRYMSVNGMTKKYYDTAIGIRADEINRVGDYYYPLVLADISKQMVNKFWDKMPFRLQLKGYEGNCKTCWKKSFRKLVTIARENPERFEFFKQMEIEYSDYIKPTQADKHQPPICFFRGYKKVSDIFEMAKDLSIENAEDDSRNYIYQSSIFHDGTELDSINGCSESCEAFN